MQVLENNFFVTYMLYVYVFVTYSYVFTYMFLMNYIFIKYVLLFRYPNKSTKIPSFSFLCLRINFLRKFYITKKSEKIQRSTFFGFQSPKIVL